MIYFQIIINTVSNEIKIVYKINESIITSHDILDEINYLKSLNKNLAQLNNEQLISNAENSLIREIIKNDEIKKLSADRIWSETSRALNSSYPNIYFEKIITLNLKNPFFKNLNIASCHSHKDPEVRWAELQINNGFEIGEQLPIPNEFKHASNILKNISKIDMKINDNDLISILITSNFKRNEDLINKLVTLPNLEKTKDFILKLVKEIRNTNFSTLSSTPKEKVEQEKFNMYKNIIFKCK